MRKLIPALFALALLAIPAAGNAQISLGLRLGYAPALGEAAKDSDMSDGVKSQIPLQLDATYHLTPAFSLGGYASYGFGQTGEVFDQICDVADCSARVVRIGVQGIYSFNPIGQLRPFAGVGAGYEWGSLTAEAGDEEVTVSFRGFELLNLTAGADYVVGPQFAIGPYVGLSVGRYSNTSIDDGFEEISARSTRRRCTSGCSSASAAASTCRLEPSPSGSAGGRGATRAAAERRPRRYLLREHRRSPCTGAGSARLSSTARRPIWTRPRTSGRRRSVAPSERARGTTCRSRTARISRS